MRSRAEVKAYVGKTEYGYQVTVTEGGWHKTSFRTFTRWGAGRQVRAWARRRNVTDPITFIHY